jgi:hypothetical protein
MLCTDDRANSLCSPESPARSSPLHLAAGSVPVAYGHGIPHHIEHVILAVSGAGHDISSRYVIQCQMASLSNIYYYYLQRHEGHMAAAAVRPIPSPHLPNTNNPWWQRLSELRVIPFRQQWSKVCGYCIHFFQKRNLVGAATVAKETFLECQTILPTSYSVGIQLSWLSILSYTD